MSSSDFWQLKAPTEHVDFSTADKKTHWHCIGCIGKWEHGQEAKTKLLVFGQSQLGVIDLDHEQRAFCIYVGDLRPDQNNRFQLMQSNVLASKLDEHGLPVTKDSVLKVIRDLNDLADERFGRDERVVTLRASDPSRHSKWGWHVPVCGNSALSMEAVGQSVKAFVIDRRETSVMHQDQVDFL